MTDSARTLFRILAWATMLAIVAQVFLAGMVVVARQMDWGGHEALGHSMGFLMIAMIFVVYLGKASRRLKMLTWALFVVWFIQSYVLIIFVRERLPILAAFHPVLALVDFLLIHRMIATSKDEVPA